MIDLIDKITGIDRNELDDQQMRNYKKISYIALAVYALVSIIFLLCSCSTTRYVPVENVRTEYKDRVVTVHDTVRDSVIKLNDVYKHDSVLVRMKGDTVFVDRWHTLKQTAVDKGRTLQSIAAHDTVFVYKADSVRVPVPVERKLMKWERVKMDFGTAAIVIAAIAILAGIVLAVWWIRKRIRGDLRLECRSARYVTPHGTGHRATK